jgi:DNA-binding transcriptional regulator YdaS (Cro superfamily)
VQGQPPGIGHVQRNVALQRQWYGEPLGDRVRRLVVAFAVSQAQLADVLGVSPPMLSQLMSGRRAKIGNPAVLARMVMLERRVLTPDVASGDRAAIRRALEEVRDSRPTVSHGSIPHGSIPVAEGDAEESALVALRRVVGRDELVGAAEALDGRFPSVAGLLRRAAAES